MLQRPVGAAGAHQDKGGAASLVEQQARLVACGVGMRRRAQTSMPAAHRKHSVRRGTQLWL